MLISFIGMSLSPIRFSCLSLIWRNTEYMSNIYGNIGNTVFRQQNAGNTKKKWWFWHFSRTFRLRYRNKNSSIIWAEKIKIGVWCYWGGWNLQTEYWRKRSCKRKKYSKTQKSCVFPWRKIPLKLILLSLNLVWIT